MKRLARLLTLAVAFALVAASCSTETTTSREVFEPGPVLDQLTITPGQATWNTLDIDGTPLRFALFVPSGHSIGDEAPLLLALPPGDQAERNVQEVMPVAYVPEAERRGWVVVSPVAPGGVKFFEGSEDLIGPLLDRLEAAFPPESGRTHVAGISNGGISTFRIAAQYPDRVASLTAFPGFPRSSSDQDALDDLTDIPISMFVGENDGQWVTAAEDAVARLNSAGADVSYEVLAGQGHILTPLWTGPTLWNTLADARFKAQALGAG